MHTDFIQKREKVQILEEITGQCVSVIFDGTCRLGEALCLVVRYISDDWSIGLQKSLKGEEIAREIISTLCGRPFVTTTYKLEGDGALVLSCYEVIEELEASVRSCYTPNLDAVIQRLSASTPRSPPQLKAYAMRYIQPGQIRTNLQDAVSIFKAARLFLPHRVHVTRPTANCVDSLSILPFLSAQTLSELKEELPLYISKVSDVGASFCPVVAAQLHKPAKVVS